MITAYRVCQEKGSPAYQQQYTLMRQAGISDPNPRQHVLDAIRTLIQEHRAKGYRPIVMMDANGDYRTDRTPDRALATFITNSNLSDPFYEKFTTSPRTFLYGSKRLDYIFMDPALILSIRNIGYLGTHMGADSDHCLAYVDFDEKQLFAGLINRPVPHHSCEILIAQADKVQEFVEALTSKLDEHRIPQKIMHLADGFAHTQATPINAHRYNTIYGEFLDITKSIAKKVGRKKYGYNRSPALTTAGQLFLIHKHAYDCKHLFSIVVNNIMSILNIYKRRLSLCFGKRCGGYARNIGILLKGVRHYALIGLQASPKIEPRQSFDQCDIR